jgi:hypothetical protein
MRTQDEIIRLAYREDAPPFSYKDNIGKPAGYGRFLPCGRQEADGHQQLPNLAENLIAGSNHVQEPDMRRGWMLGAG